MRLASIAHKRMPHQAGRRQPARAKTLLKAAQSVRASSDSIRHPAARPAAGDSRQRWPRPPDATRGGQFHSGQRAAPRPIGASILGIDQVRSSAWKWDTLKLSPRYGPDRVNPDSGQVAGSSRRLISTSRLRSPEKGMRATAPCCRLVNRGERQCVARASLAVTCALTGTHELARADR